MILDGWETSMYLILVGRRLVFNVYSYLLLRLFSMHHIICVQLKIIFLLRNLCYFSLYCFVGIYRKSYEIPPLYGHDHARTQ